ncbi:MAG: hypothetical protein D3922_08500 [Candidatus Electrothrix sp. AR1]|nr:hypothetical protein [Candidatus Electrothrix sp. AR1]
MICTKKTAILTLTLATTWSVNALAQPQNSISKPPLEAYTACEGKQPDEQSSFVTQAGNTISGQCKQQQDGRLILIPELLREGSKIPPAAHENCIGKKIGDPVQFTTPTGKTISGTCQSEGDQLYLRPDSPPGMNAGIHAGMKTHKEGLYQELLNGSKQPDTQQQAPDQNEDDSSNDYQQQSTPPEDMHSNIQEPDTQQQAPHHQNEVDSSDGNQQQQSDSTNSVEKPEEQQSQPQQQPVENSVQKPQEKPQEKSKGFLDKVKDFWKNLW